MGRIILGQGYPCTVSRDENRSDFGGPKLDPHHYTKHKSDLLSVKNNLLRFNPDLHKSLN